MLILSFTYTLPPRSSIKAQDRRKIYISSLEALVDSLHSQMLSYALYPVPFEQLEKLSGLHSKTAMVRFHTSPLHRVLLL